MYNLLNNNPLYHLSHTDMDGYTCQLIIDELNLSNYHFFNANYGLEVKTQLETIITDIDQNEHDANILITDLNLLVEEGKYLERQRERLAKKGISITLQLLDHHASGKESAEKFSDWYHLDTTKSATLITYEYVQQFHPLPSSVTTWLEPFVHVVNAADIWINNSELFELGKVALRVIADSKELTRYMFDEADRAYKFHLLKASASFVNQSDSHILLDEQTHQLKKTFFTLDHNDTLANLVSRYIINLIGTMKENVTIYYRGYKGLLTYTVGNTSIIGNALLLAYDEFDFVIDVGFRGTLSLRANFEVDVSVIAKEIASGGGHPNASGGKLKEFNETFSYQYAKEQITAIFKKCEPSSKLPLKQS